MNDQFRNWLETTGARHGFTAPASSSADASWEALDAEAHSLFERARRLVDELRIAVTAGALDDYIARVNTFRGRLRDPANEHDAQEMRRVITDLHEVIADFESRLREVERATERTIEDVAAGRAARATPPQGSATGSGQGPQPSGRPDASFADLNRQAQRLFRRAAATLEAMRLGLPDGERRSLAARLNVFNGRIRDPALRGNAQEMRRIVTELYAAAQDLERRQRELERAPEEIAREILAGGRLSPDSTEDDPGGNASSRPDATFAELNAEGRRLYDRLAELFGRLSPRLPERERNEMAARINTISGRVEDRANQGDAREMRRIIAAQRALIQDVNARLRES